MKIFNILFSQVFYEISHNNYDKNYLIKYL